MSSKCPGCGFYTLACQCNKDDNYCGRCGRVISDCRCDDHHDHYTYGQPPSSEPNCNFDHGYDNNSSEGNDDDGDNDD